MAALAGLGAGALHVVTGPDHLAALGPVASRAPERAIGLGALWGVGHGIGVLFIAGLARLGGSALDLARFADGAEVAVGAVLVVLGVRALRAVPSPTGASPPHPSHPARPGARSALGVGLLHGAAGAHHLLVVLPGLVLGPAEAALYLAAYLVSATLAMAAAGALVAVGMRGRGGPARSTIHRLMGAAALLTGIAWIGVSLA